MKNQFAEYKQLRFLTCICIAAFLCALGFFLISKASLIRDAKQFDVLGWNLALDRGFVNEVLEPTMAREPAYPYFLSIIYRIFGHNYEAVFVIQSILFSGIVALSFFLAKYIFGIETAKVSSIIIAVFPTLGNYTIYILSEIFFIFCLMAFVLILTRSLNPVSYIGIFASSIMLAVLVLTKAIMMFFVFFLISAFFIFDFRKKGFFNRFFLKSLILLLVVSIFVFPWIVRNKRIFGTCSIAERGGKALYNRSIKLDYDWEKWKRILLYSVSEFLGGKIYPNPDYKTSEVLLIEDHLAEERLKRLINSGLSPPQADKALIKEALIKIKSMPLRYIGQSFLESVKLLGFTYIPSLNEKSTIDSFRNLKNGEILLSFTRGIFRLFAYPIFFFCIGGILISLKDWRKWLIMFTAIFYIMTAYGLTFSWARYTVPLIPCYIIFMVNFIRRIFSDYKAGKFRYPRLSGINPG